MIRRTAALSILVMMSTWVMAAHSPPERQRIFARLPDWTGIWVVDDGIMTRLGLRNDVEGDSGKTFKDLIILQNRPYNAEWRTKFQNALKAFPTQASKECGFHFPGVMEFQEFEVLTTPEQTAFLFEGREIRHVYTDGRSHPPADELWPMAWGDSIGHWEGETLVVDTISVVAEPTISNASLGVILSPEAHYSERIRKVGKDRLEDVMTVVDPVALTKPWVLTFPYKRVTSINRMIHGDCLENDRNPVVDGKLTVIPP
jgi:hypothetical protein